MTFRGVYNKLSLFFVSIQVSVKMSDTEVTKMQTAKNGSSTTAKEKSKGVVQKESKKNIASDVGAKKDCEEDLNETQKTELVAQLASMRISNSEKSFKDLKGNAKDERTVSGQAVDSNNASTSGYPSANENKPTASQVAKNIYFTVSRAQVAVEKLCGKFEEFYKLENKRNKDYKSHFDAMYAKVLEDTKNILHGDIKNIRPASGHVNNSVENIPEADLSDNKTEECEFVTHVGPNDLVLILDSTLFETGQGYAKETTEGDNAGLTINERKDQQNKSLNTEINMTSKEQETAGHTEREMNVLEIQSVDFKAKHLKPVIKVEQNAFRISFDVSFFDIENITCVVGDKLDVQARVSRRSDYGSETHEIHQMFDVPALADREKFTACIKNGLLHLEAPMKDVKEELTDAS